MHVLPKTYNHTPRWRATQELFFAADCPCATSFRGGDLACRRWDLASCGLFWSRKKVVRGRTTPDLVGGRLYEEHGRPSAQGERPRSPNEVSFAHENQSHTIARCPRTTALCRDTKRRRSTYSRLHRQAEERAPLIRQGGPALTSTFTGLRNPGIDYSSWLFGACLRHLGDPAQGGESTGAGDGNRGGFGQARESAAGQQWWVVVRRTTPEQSRFGLPPTCRDAHGIVPGETLVLWPAGAKSLFCGWPGRKDFLRQSITSCV